MENWKERFEYIYVIEENKGEKYLRKYDHTTIVEELEHFISQELDKAREEGRREILEQFKNYWDNDYLGDYPKFGNAGIGMIKGEMRDYINEELSKLKQ